MPKFWTPQAWLPEGWTAQVLLETDAAGSLTALVSGVPCPPDAIALAGPVLPGLPNLHSHAFQRALAGRTEIAGPSADSFWSWRERMYGLVERLDEESFRAIARELFVELLKGGYTTVCEFHYLHRAPDGAWPKPAWRYAGLLLEAAQDVGIALTLLPVLYMASDFGGQPLAPRQKRFAGDPEQLLRMVEALRTRCRGNPTLRIGVAPHSLRAVPEDALREVCRGLRSIDPTAPLHLHVAEQRAEVKASLAHSGKRPAEWLLQSGLVDAHCCLVHATHLEVNEVRALAASGAVAGLCPSTEANLGDGFFPLAEFLAAGGSIGIGSDSNIASTAFEELRLLEYGQRLAGERRNVAAAGEGESTGARLWTAALAGGAQAAGQPTGALKLGLRADFLVLEPAHPALLGLAPAHWLDALVFASHASSPIRDVYLAGQAVIHEGRHAREAEFAADFSAAVARLF